MAYNVCQATALVLLLSTALVLFIGSSAQEQQAPIQQFRTCVNGQFHFAPTTWDKAVHHDILPKLFMEKAWQTKKPLLGPLTLATHTSYDRLFQLRAQCKSWGGPLVVAVHLALLQPDGLHALTHENAVAVQAITQHLGRFFNRMESVPRCQLSMMLLWEVYSNEAARILYPYNMLRNYALVQARTELVSMLDVDLLPSQNLFPELLTPSSLADTLKWAANKTAVVLPAFETVPGDYGFTGEMAVANRAVHGGKQTISTLVAQGLVRPFHLIRYSPGHNCTNYPLWYTATDAYTITPTNAYEPWFILLRSATPWYDVRYRGYFYDKIVYVSALKYMGYTYVAHPRAYIMHRPHNLTEALQSPLLPQLQDVMFAKFTKDLRTMAAVQYSPVVDVAFMRCANKLTWFPQFPQNQGAASAAVMQHMEAFSVPAR